MRSEPRRPGLRGVLVEDPDGAFLVTVLVTMANVLLSPLIAQLNDLIAFIHSGNVAVCHSCSRSVSEVLGGASDLRIPNGTDRGAILHYELLVSTPSQRIGGRIWGGRRVERLPVRDAQAIEAV